MKRKAVRVLGRGEALVDVVREAQVRAAMAVEIEKATAAISAASTMESRRKARRYRDALVMVSSLGGAS